MTPDGEATLDTRALGDDRRGARVRAAEAVTSVSRSESALTAVSPVLPGPGTAPGSAAAGAGSASLTDSPDADAGRSGGILARIPDATRVGTSEVSTDAPVPAPTSTETGGARTPRWWSRLQTLMLLQVVLYVLAAPLMRTSAVVRVGWYLLVVIALVGAWSMIRAPRRGMAPALLLLTMFVLWGALYPVWSAWRPEGAPRSQGRSLITCFVIIVGTLGLTGPTPAGLQRLRRMWLFVAVATAMWGVVEVVSGRHFSPAGPYGPPGFSPSGTYGNPNNMAAVLLVCIGVVGQRLTDRIGAAYRAALAVLGFTLCVLLALTLSRLALASLVVVGLALLTLELHRRGLALSGPGRRGIWAGGVGVGVLVVLSFVVPALRAINPVAQILMPDGESARSDSLRVTLMRIAVNRWLDSPWVGVGGARFENILKREHPEVGRILPLHNTFLEILLENGVVVLAPLVLVVIVAIVRTVRSVPRVPRVRAQGRLRRLDTAGVWALSVTFIVAFLMTGVLVSSAVIWSPWWLMATSMAVTAWHLGPRSDGWQRIRDALAARRRGSDPA